MQALVVVLDPGYEVLKVRVSLDQFVVLEDLFYDQEDGVFIFY